VAILECTSDTSVVWKLNNGPLPSKTFGHIDLCSFKYVLTIIIENTNDFGDYTCEGELDHIAFIAVSSIKPGRILLYMLKMYYLSLQFTAKKLSINKIGVFTHDNYNYVNNVVGFHSKFQVKSANIKPIFSNLILKYNVYISGASL